MRYGYEILEDRYFSDYDYEDALYERAFSEGYEYAQREFNYLSRRSIKRGNRAAATFLGTFGESGRRSAKIQQQFHPIRQIEGEIKSVNYELERGNVLAAKRHQGRAENIYSNLKKRNPAETSDITINNIRKGREIMKSGSEMQTIKTKYPEVWERVQEQAAKKQAETEQKQQLIDRMGSLRKKLNL